FLWGLHAKVAKLFRKPVYFAFQGIGPFKTKKGEKWARKTLQKATFISVRDADSFDRVKKIVGKKRNTKIVQSFDPVFVLLEEEKYYNRITNVLSIIPR